ILTSRSACGKGNGRSSTPSTTEKIAVFAPIPSASVKTATRVKPGDLRNWRRANLRSFMSFSSQSDDWIYARSAAGGNPRSEESSGKQQRADGEIYSWVEPASFEQNALQRARQHDRGQQPDCRSNQKQMQPMRQNERADLGRARAECDSN